MLSFFNPFPEFYYSVAICYGMVIVAAPCIYRWWTIFCLQY